jgi:hypothetical protein
MPARLAAKTRDPEASRLRIRAAAKAEFAKKMGCARRRHHERARVNKQMMYHFGNKEELFRIVLEEAYSLPRSGRTRPISDPVTAMKELVTLLELLPGILNF